MNFLVYTMVYNESQNLPRWINYYGRELGFSSLLVIDHGSDDGSTDNLGEVGKILIPRKKFNEVERCQLISGIQQTLCPHYDAIVFVDCDEFLVPDPAKYNSLLEYLEGFVSGKAACVRSVGLNLVHMHEHEPPLDSTRLVLEQRNYVWFHSIYCKPAVVAQKVNWAIGFHNSSLPSKVDPELYLFHLRDLDYDVALARLAVTRDLDWEPHHIKSGVDWHQRLSDQDYIVSRFRKPQSEMEQKGPQPFEFSSEIERMNSSESGDFFGKISIIPDRFKSRF